MQNGLNLCPRRNECLNFIVIGGGWLRGLRDSPFFSRKRETGWDRMLFVMDTMYTRSRELAWSSRREASSFVHVNLARCSTPYELVAVMLS